MYNTEQVSNMYLEHGMSKRRCYLASYEGLEKQQEKGAHRYVGPPRPTQKRISQYIHGSG